MPGNPAPSNLATGGKAFPGLIQGATQHTTGKSTSSTVTAILTIGAELGMLGIATLIAASNEDVGKVIAVFMVGLLILFIMLHNSLLTNIPNLFTLGATKTNAL